MFALIGMQVRIAELVAEGKEWNRCYAAQAPGLTVLLVRDAKDTSMSFHFIRKPVERLTNGCLQMRACCVDAACCVSVESAGLSCN